MRILIVILLIASLVNVAMGEDLPVGVKKSGFYEVEITSLTNLAVTYLNNGQYKERDAFILRMNGVTNEDLQKLSMISWIKNLYFSNLKEKIDLSLLEPLKELDTLEIKSAPPDMNYEFLNMLPKLRVLDFQGGNITNISFLEKLPQITSLTLHGVTTISDYSPLSNMELLVYLSVSQNRKNAEDLAPISKLTNLETLKLGGYTGTSLNFISPCKKLRKIDCIFSKNLSDISAVKNFSQLEDLSLQGTMVTDLSALTECSKLKSLNIMDTKVEDIEPLLKIKSLKDVTLPETLSETAKERLKMAFPNANIR